MNGGNYLLDTVIVAAYFNREETIRQKLRDTTIYISAITIGELLFGDLNSQKVEANLSQIKLFVSLNSILVCDEKTADYYGMVKRDLRVKGRPIPEMIYGLRRQRFNIA